ncbi:LysR family transcriptional regulator [Arthrobacter sp. Br18]|uniref:LysR family transcriptional regulator n=1 Tax=Arthrobacter sp. Br18 TaxID=1312954 RepID=UPI0004B5771D|nr:LysR family transcriptional regulator [Arthrobacter sp. Br18]
MAKSAGSVCDTADVPLPDPQDLLILLAVSKSGRFTSAADSLGLNHTTVSRRIAALEKSLGGHVLLRSTGGWELTDLGRRAVRAAEGVADAVAQLADDDGGALTGVVRMSATDGFSAYIAAPAFARLRAVNPGLSIEIVAATRRASQTRSGLDLEVVVGEPQVHRAEAVRLGAYVLGLYGATSYLEEHGRPASVDGVLAHSLVYFIDSMLQVDSLDAPRRLLPSMRDSLSSTNVFVHVEATRAGAGLGLLPCFMADRHADLVRLLPGDIAEKLDYWLVARPDSLRQPAVAVVVRALRQATAEYEPELLGRG